MAKEETKKKTVKTTTKQKTKEVKSAKSTVAAKKTTTKKATPAKKVEKKVEKKPTEKEKNIKSLSKEKNVKSIDNVEVIEKELVIYNEDETESSKTVENKKSNITKIILIVILIIAFFGGMFLLSEYAVDHSGDTKEVYQDANNPLLGQGESIEVDKMKDYKKITYDEFEKFLQDKKNVSVFVGSESCSWCTYQKPIMKSVAYDNDLEIYYLDLATLTSEQIKNFNKLHDELKEEKYGTPMFFELNDGKVKSISHGAKSRKDLIEVFKEQNFIKS